MDALDMGQQRADLGLREHRRQAARFLRPVHLVQPRQLDAEHFLVEEEDCRQGLVLRGRRDVALGGQSGEEGGHFRGAHLARMAQAMEVDEPLHPLRVGALRAQAVVPEANAPAQLFEQAGRRLRCIGLHGQTTPDSWGS